MPVPGPRCWAAGHPWVLVLLPTPRLGAQVPWCCAAAGSAQGSWPRILTLELSKGFLLRAGEREPRKARSGHPHSGL